MTLLAETEPLYAGFFGTMQVAKGRRERRRTVGSSEEKIVELSKQSKAERVPATYFGNTNKSGASLCPAQQCRRLNGSQARRPHLAELAYGAAMFQLIARAIKFKSRSYKSSQTEGQAAYSEQKQSTRPEKPEITTLELLLRFFVVRRC